MSDPIFIPTPRLTVRRTGAETRSVVLSDATGQVPDIDLSTWINRFRIESADTVEAATLVVEIPLEGGADMGAGA